MNCNVKLCNFTKPINDLKDELKGSIFIFICVVKHGHFEAGNLMISQQQMARNLLLLNKNNDFDTYFESRAQNTTCISHGLGSRKLAQ